MLYVGETMRFECEVVNPRTGAPLAPAPTSAMLEAWAPGHSPAVAEPDVTAPLELVNGIWSYDHDTAGMTPGRWVYRVIAVRPTGGRSFEYASFVLHPIPTAGV